MQNPSAEGFPVTTDVPCDHPLTLQDLTYSEGFP